MKPNVVRRISVRNRSGRLVTSPPGKVRLPSDPRVPLRSSLILPAVGLAMQPIRLASVVFPEPLGPTRPVTSLARTTRLTPSTVV